MLPRVSAALAEFIAPIASSSKQSGPQAHPKDAAAFKRFTEKREEKGENPQNQKKETLLARVIPFSRAKTEIPTASTESASPDSKNLPAEKKSLLPPPIITFSLLQLMKMLQDQRATLMRWLGGSLYEASARNQKKSGKCRKGTILDQRVE